MNRKLHLVPTLVLAVAVLVMSVAGSATAAKLITGKQVKNGTITSADVRNNNLTGADLRNGGATGADLKDGSITGADVAAGSIGAGDLAPGARSGASAQEVVAGQSLETCSSVLLNCTGSMTRVLETGTWFVSASLTMANDDNAVTSANERCGLVNTANDDNLHEVRYQLAALGDPGHLQSLSLQSVVVVGASTPVQLVCTEFTGEDLVLVDANLAAVKVGDAS